MQNLKSYPISFNNNCRWEQLQKKAQHMLQQTALGVVGEPVASHYPAFIPAMLAAGFQSIKKQNEGTTIEPLLYAIHFRFGVNLVPVYDMEFAFPVTLDDGPRGFKTLLDAVRIVVDLTQRHAQFGMYTLAFT